MTRAVSPPPELPSIELERDDRKRARTAAIRIAVIYMAATVVYIAASDYLVHTLVAATIDPETPAAIRQQLFNRRVLTISTYKGWAFAIVTGALLYFLVRRYIGGVLTYKAEARALLERSESEYRVLFAGNPLPMWVFYPDDMRIIAVNEMTILTLGYTREQLMAMTVLDLVVPAQRPELRALINGVRNTPPTVRAWQLLRSDGGIVDMECTGHSIMLDGRRARMVVAVDVTERLRTQRALDDYRRDLEQRVEERTQDLRRSNLQLQDEIRMRQRIEEELRDAKWVAESADANKTLFLARTTHEIRLPLTSILGYAELLLSEPALPAPVAQNAEVIRHNAMRLLSLIEDLLDLSRIESAQLAIRPAPVSPRAIVGEVEDLFRRRAAVRGLTLTASVADDVPESITTDPARLRQILVNLVGNAIKFTERGGVTVQVAKRPPDHLVFSVRDTGPGIAPDRLPDIFTPFYQASDGNLDSQGAGLGLAISRQLAELLGGRLEAMSQLGNGSTFSATIRTFLSAGAGAPPAPPANGHATPPTHHGPTGTGLNSAILVAEDDPHIRWLVGRFLENAGARVTAVPDGDAAVASVEAARTTGNSYALIILDMHMPGMNGPRAARAIRELGHVGPIVGLTASPSEADRAALLTGGCNAIAEKPINRDTFLPMLRQLLATPQSA